jgi:hypothetical protein
MASVVAALSVAGGKSVLSRTELDQICDLMNIKDPVKSDLPVGPACTYYLYLSSTAPIPNDCADANEPLMRLLEKKVL